MKEIKRILIPTDGSSHADVAIEHGLDLAKLLKKPVFGLYIVDQPAFQAFPPESLLVDVGDLIRKEAEGVLLRLTQKAKKMGVDATTEVRDGHPTDEICKAATPDDLIVIATHGRRGLARVLLGSVAESVIRHAPCPVLVIRNRRK